MKSEDELLEVIGLAIVKALEAHAAESGEYMGDGKFDDADGIVLDGSFPIPPLARAALTALCGELSPSLVVHSRKLTIDYEIKESGSIVPSTKEVTLSSVDNAALSARLEEAEKALRTYHTATLHSNPELVESTLREADAMMIGYFAAYDTKAGS